MIGGIRRHLTDEHAAAASRRGLAVLNTYGLDQRALLPRLATEAAGGDPTIAISFAALAQQLLHAADELP